MSGTLLIIWKLGAQGRWMHFECLSIHALGILEKKPQGPSLHCELTGAREVQLLPTHFSVQFSHSVVSNSLWPHRLQHAGPLCPSPTPEAYSNSCPSSGDTIQPSHPLSPLLLLPSIFPSIRVFSNESILCIRWPKYWSFNFHISLSNEYSRLISFQID